MMYALQGRDSAAPWPRATQDDPQPSPQWICTEPRGHLERSPSLYRQLPSSVFCLHLSRLKTGQATPWLFTQLNSSISSPLKLERPRMLPVWLLTVELWESPILGG